MKARSPITITISLAILAATSLPIIAQSVRFPTDAELQELIEKFRRFAASPPVEVVDCIAQIGANALRFSS
ncbi:MAG: hypothetical protein ACBR50_00400 [Microcoleus sp.]